MVVILRVNCKGNESPFISKSLRVTRERGGSSSELGVFEDEEVVLPVSSTKTGIFEDEMGIWAVSSTKLRDFEDEVIDRTQNKGPTQRSAEPIGFNGKGFVWETFV